MKIARVIFVWVVVIVMVMSDRRSYILILFEGQETCKAKFMDHIRVATLYEGASNHHREMGSVKMEKTGDFLKYRQLGLQNYVL